MNYIAKNKDKEVELALINTRNIEFAIYNSTIGMNGKRVFPKYKKPSDLYDLPSDPKEKPLTGAKTIGLLDTLTKKH